MSLSELATLSRYNIPVVVVVMNNGVLGMVRQWQKVFYDCLLYTSLKNDNGYRILAETPFDWGCGKEYCIDVQVIGNKISAEIEGCCLEAVDEEKPYLFGAVGVSMQNGTHDKYRKIVISDC